MRRATETFSAIRALTLGLDCVGKDGRGAHVNLNVEAIL